MTTLESFAHYARNAADDHDADARRHFEDFVGRADTCLAVREHLPITNWLGRHSYLPEVEDYCGPFDPGQLEHVFYFIRRYLAEAEAQGQVYEALGRLGMSGKEDWWRVEATFYRHHFGHLSDADGRTAFDAAAQSAAA